MCIEFSNSTTIIGLTLNLLFNQANFVRNFKLLFKELYFCSFCKAKLNQILLEFVLLLFTLVEFYISKVVRIANSLRNNQTDSKNFNLSKIKKFKIFIQN